MKPKTLLIGKNGQLGWELGRYLRRLGEVIALDRQQLDLTRLELIHRIVREFRPSLIVNAAAYTSVDQAETEVSTAQIVNGEAPGVIAEAGKEVGAALVHFSTDYVFDGKQNSPYRESDPPSPINSYGRTKLAGEKAIEAVEIPHLILRTGWVYGTRGKNFFLTIVRRASQKQELRVVDDQIGAPTWSRMIAAKTTEILAQIYSSRPECPFSGEYTGTYHLTAGGQTSWRGFAQAILDDCSDPRHVGPWFAATTNSQPLIATRAVPISTAEFPTHAQRPAYSVLSNAKLFRVFGVQLLPWHSQLGLCIRDADVALGPDSAIPHGPNIR
jgi:dTDP-4-dehydrorhamnose reductase